MARSVVSVLLAVLALAWPSRASELAAPIVSRDAATEIAADEAQVRVLEGEIELRLDPRRVHLKKGEITVAIAKKAAELLDADWGSETIVRVEGKKYSFCVEPHYHSPESGKHPVGWHKGVTVYNIEE